MAKGVDIIIQGQDIKRKKKESDWESDLRHARYSEALDRVLAGTDKTAQLTLITALRHRSALRTALMNRDEVTLQPIMKWVYKYIMEPRLVNLCVEVGMNILDIYSGNLGQSADVDAQVIKLHKRVREEVDRAQQAWQTKGMLDMLKVS